MIKIIIFFLFLSIESYASVPPSFEKNFHSRLMEIGWGRTINEINNYAPDEQRFVLERLLIACSSDQLPRSEERQGYVNKAQQMLLESPGHAIYYQEQTESLRKLAIENEGRSIPEQTRMHDQGIWVGFGEYNDARQRAFEVLSLLPSAESVKVLGHFLNDPEGLDGVALGGGAYRTSDFEGFPPNCSAAAKALRKLQIANSPESGLGDFSSTAFDPKEVEAWKDWWNEIVAGKRTYRFIGSDIEYGPDGPASAEQIQKIERNHKREGAAMTGARRPLEGNEEESSAPKLSNPFSITALIASCLFLTSGIWYFLRRRVRTK